MQHGTDEKWNAFARKHHYQYRCLCGAIGGVSHVDRGVMHGRCDNGGKWIVPWPWEQAAAS